MDRFIAEFNPTDILDIPIVAAVAGWVNDPVVDGTQTLVPREGFIGYAQDVVSDAPALIPDCFCYGNLVKSDSSFEQHLIPPLEEYDVNIGAWLWKSTAENTQLQVVLEEPVNGDVHGGIGNLRGWAISSETIDRIEIYIDGVFAFDAPYGGSRPDVSELFPTVPGSEQSGFSLAYGYSNLEAGIHTITAKAITAEGSIAESTSTFTVVRFDEVFIGPEQTVDTSQAVITVAGDEILMNGILVGDKIYDLRLKWRTAEQGFEIIEIQ